MNDRAHEYPNLTVVGSAGTSIESQSTGKRFEVVLERGAPVETS